MKKRVLSTLLVVALSAGLLVGCGAGKGGESIDLVKGGVSDYVIVHSAEATDTEVNAAQELQEYMMDISGAEIPIVTDDTAETEKEIIVGKTNREGKRDFDRDELGEDGFVIKTADSKLWLVGGGDRGTIYSVYAFLEDYLGCAFYTSDVEVVPEKSDITVAIKEDEQIPAFKMRGIRAVGYMDEDISVKRHLNFAMAGRNLSEEVGGGIRYCNGVAGHTYELFVPPTEYFAEHPEYFSMNKKGERVAAAQLCLTNPDVLEIVIREAKEWLEEDPADIIAVSANDNPDACLCKNCKEVYLEEGGAFSGTTLRFANAVAEALKEDYPNVKVATYAYSFTRSAPTKTKPADNVIINFATMGTCFGHLKTDECEGVVSAGTYVNDKTSTYLEDMEAWSKLCKDNQFWLRDYSTDFGYPLTPFPDFSFLRENMKLYAENGLNGNEHECALSDGNKGEFSELRGYLISKLLWDPYMSEEEYNGYMDGFIKAVYGEGAASYIKEYIDLVKKEVDDKCFDLVVEPTTRYPIPPTTNHSANELPEDLTVDMVKNYQNTDWTKYWNWYKGVEETSITSEGEELFKKALATAETELQKKKITWASFQVTYLKSFYKYEQMNKGGVKDLVANFIAAHAGEFTEAEKQSLPATIEKFATTQVEKAYYDFNYDYCANMVKEGFTAIRHSLAGWKDFDFLMPPSAWN